MRTMVCALVEAGGRLWRLGDVRVVGATLIERVADVPSYAHGTERNAPRVVETHVQERGGRVADTAGHAVLAIASTSPVRRSWLRCTLMHDWIALTSPIR